MTINNTARSTAATHDRAYRKPSTAKHQPRLSAPAFDPSRVSTTLQTVTARTVLDEAARTDRLVGRERPLPIIEAGVHTSLDSLGMGTRWTEHHLSDCRYGCKVYENDLTGRLVLAHNAAYGCTSSSK